MRTACWGTIPRKAMKAVDLVAESMVEDRSKITLIENVFDGRDEVAGDDKILSVADGASGCTMVNESIIAAEALCRSGTSKAFYIYFYIYFLQCKSTSLLLHAAVIRLQSS